MNILSLLALSLSVVFAVEKHTDTFDQQQLEEISAHQSEVKHYNLIHVFPAELVYKIMIWGGPNLFAIWNILSKDYKSFYLTHERSFFKQWLLGYTAQLKNLNPFSKKRFCSTLIVDIPPDEFLENASGDLLFKHIENGLLNKRSALYARYAFKKKKYSQEQLEQTKEILISMENLENVIFLGHSFNNCEALAQTVLDNVGRINCLIMPNNLIEKMQLGLKEQKFPFLKKIVIYKESDNVLQDPIIENFKNEFSSLLVDTLSVGEKTYMNLETLEKELLKILN